MLTSLSVILNMCVLFKAYFKPIKQKVKFEYRIKLGFLNSICFFTSVYLYGRY